MKKGWKIITLGEACDKGSSNVSKNQLDKIDGDYPIYGASGIIKNVNFYHQDKPYLSIVKDGAGFGRVTRMDALSSVIGTLQYILPKEGIDLNYLYYSLILIDYNKYVAGAAIPHIYFKDYAKEPFLWMPLLEQQQLVAVLGEAFNSIDKAKSIAEQNLKNAKELFESYLQSFFVNPGEEWEENNFENCIDKVTYTTKIQRNKFLKTGEFPIVSQEKDLINGFWNKKDDLFEIKKPVIVFGDHTQILKYVDFNFVLGADGVKILQPKDILYSKFFYYFVKSISLKSLGYARHYRLLKEKHVCYPKSLIEQKSIVAKLDTLSVETKNLEMIYTQKLADLDELKKSFLQKAFSGEL